MTCDPNERLTLAQINALSQRAFVDVFKDIYEHSAWIASEAWRARPFANRDDLHAAMWAVVNNASPEARLKLLRAHPDLAGKEAERGTLTHYSDSEQAQAGLNACSAEELEEIRKLNSQYKEKFGFPFIVAVKGLSRGEILRLFGRRLGNSKEVEFTENLKQVGRIAGFRLAALVAED